MTHSASLDLDEIALIRKPRPWGWFVAGLLVIAGAGVVLGYYVPLRSAHHLLATEHEKLGQKASELNQALVKARADLETDAGKIHAFERDVEDTTRAKRKAQDAHEMIRDGISANAKSLVQSKVLVVEASEESSHVTLPTNLVFPRGAKVVAPSLTKTLCAVARTAKDQSFVTLEADVEFVPPLDEKFLGVASSQLASLATLLTSTCQFPAERTRFSLAPRSTLAPEKEGISLRFVARPSGVGAGAKSEAK